MPTNLRDLGEHYLGVHLEGVFKMPVVLTDPDGEILDTSENDGEALGGQVLYDTVRQNPETGDPLVSENPIVTLRRSSLKRVPISGETWGVKIPGSPKEGAALVDYVIDPTRSLEGGKTFGFIRLYLRKAEQVPE